MEKMFSSIMEGFTKGMSEDDKKRMMAYGERMAALCPCVNGKDMSDDQRVTGQRATFGFGEEKKATAEKMMSFCGGKIEMMSSFFKKMGSQSEKTDKPENT